MSVDFIRNILSEFRKRLTSARSRQEILARTAAIVGESFGCDRVSVHYIEDGEPFHAEWRENPEDKDHHEFLFELEAALTNSLQIPTLFVNDVRRSAISQPLLSHLLKSKDFSIGIIPLFQREKVQGWIECHFTRTYYRWRKEDTIILEQIGDYCTLFLERVIPGSDLKTNPNDGNNSEAQLRYRRLAEYGNLIIIRTDTKFRVIDVIGNGEKILGLSSSEILSNSGVWTRFLHPVDLRRLSVKLLRLKTMHFQINEEIRVINQRTGQVRWLLLKGVPIYSSQNEFQGWEGFGLDITEKREAEEELIAERRRIEALYEVSRSLQVNIDPAVVTLRGLKSLIRATNSDAGFGCLYDSTSGTIEIVATEGLSGTFLDSASAYINKRGLARLVVERKEGMVIPDIQEDPRAAKEIVTAEGLRSTMIVPFMFESEVLGVIILYCKRAGRYSQADFELVSAASNQLGLAARQAEVYAAEKRQAGSLAALYTLSHEVSKHLSPREVAEHSFPILQKELACKRMWLGVLNDQGTHIVGQGGFGPGLRGGILSVQIELDLRHDFFDEAIRTKQPIVVEEGAPMECSGLNRVIQKLNLGTFVIVPLVSIGKVVGVLVAEPSVPSAFFAQKKLNLLSSMANEIATVIMARRFEGKMAEANKMRMAGLLASGVAHNFNNLLQAIMGQASLLDMQINRESPLSGSARMILSAAEKGAALIRQLLSFSSPGDFESSPISVNEMLQESRDIYSSILGDQIAIDMKLAPDAPQVLGDYAQLQQAISNLLINAKEAIGVKPGGIVKLSTAKVRLRSGEIDPDLSPGVYLRLDIEDNGIGMDHERLSRCFEPFYTTKNVDSGTGLGFGGVGLGLSSAYAIMKNHEGLITASSELGDGATFSIYIPSRDPDSSEAGVSASRSSLASSVRIEREEAKVGTVRPRKLIIPQPKREILDE